MIGLLRLLIIILFLSGCAMVPMITTKSGRSVGKGNFETDASLAPSMGAAVGYGFSENFDAGIIAEQQFGYVASLWGKYSFYNNPTGWSLAAYGGAFVGASFAPSDGFFLGPIVSYRNGIIEPYLSVRFTYLTWRASEVKVEEREDSFIELNNWNDISFAYIQTDFGMNIWAADWFSISPNGKFFTMLDSEVKSSSGVVPGLSFLFIF